MHCARKCLWPCRSTTVHPDRDPTLRLARERKERAPWSLPPPFERGEIWATNLVGGASELRRIDAANPHEGRVEPVPGLLQDGGVAVVAGSIWAAVQSAALVYRLDPASEEVIAVIPMPCPPTRAR